MTFHFGYGKGYVSDHIAQQLDDVARGHGAEFRVTIDPGVGYVYWFEGANRGFAFDSSLETAVISSAEEAGLWPLEAESGENCSIESESGDTITEGLQPHLARRTAQRMANDRGRSVWLQPSGEQFDPERAR